MYNILIVDDEKKEREGIALLLKRFGFPLRTAFAQNGEDALKIMEKNHFDILLTDIKMPYMDGIQLIRETQKRGLNPICIIYSAYGEFEYAKKAMASGVSNYVLKPVDPAEFENTLNLLVEKITERRNEAQRSQWNQDSLENYFLYLNVLIKLILFRLLLILYKNLPLLHLINAHRLTLLFF